MFGDQYIYFTKKKLLIHDITVFLHICRMNGKCLQVPAKSDKIRRCQRFLQQTKSTKRWKSNLFGRLCVFGKYFRQISFGVETGRPRIQIWQKQRMLLDVPIRCSTFFGNFWALITNDFAILRSYFALLGIFDLNLLHWLSIQPRSQSY